MKFRLVDIVGTYRLVVSAELLAFIERAFVETQPLNARDAIRAEALEEAAGAELEITSDGKAISRSNGVEFYRVPLDAGEHQQDQLVFEKAPSAVVTLTVPERDRLLAHQEGKPVAEFRRS